MRLNEIKCNGIDFILCHSKINRYNDVCNVINNSEQVAELLYLGNKVVNAETPARGHVDDYNDIILEQSKCTICCRALYVLLVMIKMVTITILCAGRN